MIPLETVERVQQGARRDRFFVIHASILFVTATASAAVANNLGIVTQLVTQAIGPNFRQIWF